MEETELIIAVCKETANLEKRVALIPESAQKLKQDGVELWIESGAGDASSYPDDAYREQGFTVIEERDKLLNECDLLIAVNAPSEEDLTKLKKGATLVSFLWALQNPDLVSTLQKQNVTGIGLDAIPRISRAQSMDALSSMSNIGGYRAALIGASELDRYLPMMMTAAGTIPPAKVLVMGAGVAGLQAIATAKRLGAVVEAYDIRPVVKEQVESLGAKFVEVPVVEEEETETKGGYAKEASQKQQEKQKEVMHEHVKKSDIVITTALIPGKKAPLLVTKKMVEDMKPGSVVVDMAAEQGGNCEVTQAGETIFHNRVKVVGPLNLPSTLAFHASQLFSKNILSLLSLMLKDGELHFDFEDEIVKNSTITHNGEIISPMLKN